MSDTNTLKTYRLTLHYRNGQKETFTLDAYSVTSVQTFADAVLKGHSQEGAYAIDTTEVLDPKLTDEPTV
jgi:hypothetical protein